MQRQYNFTYDGSEASDQQLRDQLEQIEEDLAVGLISQKEADELTEKAAKVLTDYMQSIGYE